MITCPKCNKELNDGSKFCDGCGAQIFETVFCPNCGEQASTEFAFCQSCGTPLTGASAVELPVEEQPVEYYEDEPMVAPKAKGKFPGKAIAFVALGVAAIAAIVLVCSLLFGGSSGRVNHAMYLKDENIYYSTLKKNKDPIQVTDKLVDSDDVSDSGFASLGDELSDYIYMSEDSKYLFFPDKVEPGDRGATLFYREIGKSKAEPVKVDSGIAYYAVDTSTSVVTYLKPDGNSSTGTLYQYSLSKDDKEKIASDVYEFHISDDGKKVFYLKEEGDLYMQYIGKDKEKLTGDVTGIEYISEDFKTIYYMKDGDTLYKQVEGKDKEKIASDVYYVFSIYESGEIYYATAGEEEEYTMMDFITDDTDGDYDEYFYEYLENEPIYQDFTSLCFYDGKESTVITEGMMGYCDSYALEAPVIAYQACDISNIESVKLSKIEDYGDAYEKVMDALSSSSEKYIAVKAAATVIEQDEEATRFVINEEGTVAYYMDNISVEDDDDAEDAYAYGYEEEVGYGDLYRISISKKSAGKAEKYDTDVYTGYGHFTEKGEYVYFKDVKDNHGELYIDKDKISDDVHTNSVRVYSDLGKVFYKTDRDNDTGLATLNIYNGKKSTKVSDDVYTYLVDPDGRVVYMYDYDEGEGELREWVNGKDKKISDDVHDFEFSPEGDVLYLYDYSDNKYKGELHVWSGSKSRMVDEDVAAIVPVYGPVFDEDEEEFDKYHGYWGF